MLKLEDLMNLEGQKVSKRFEDYTSIIYSEPKLGKSTLNAKLYKDKALYIFGEDRYRHLEGIKVQRVSNWSEFMQLVTMLKKNKKQLLEIYPIIVISGVENLLRWCKDYILAYYGIKDLNELPFGKAHAALKDTWEKYICMLSAEGYKVNFEMHSTIETIKIPTKGTLPTELKNAEVKYDKQSGESYVEYERACIDMKPKFLNCIANICDNIMYISLSTDSNGNERRVIHLRGSLYWVAGITFEGDIPEVIELDAQTLKNTFEQAINGYDNTIEKEIKAEKTPFEDIIKQIGELGKELCKEGKRDELTSVIEEYLGVGAKVSEAKEEQYEQCTLILAKLQGLM